jgi:hypothetical protein
MIDRDRKRAFLLGHDAEFWAGLLLRAKGYRILARRYLRIRGNWEDHLLFAILRDDPRG